MSGRGRPKLSDSERERRSTICRAWAAEIKRNSGLSAKCLAREFEYGVSEKKLADDDYDGRKWRALASGSCSPSPTAFKEMTQKAIKNGWLDPFGWLRYMPYWAPQEEPDGEPYFDDEQQWRDNALSHALLMLLAHARSCGIDHSRFFSDARAELARIEAFVAQQNDEEIRSRARRIAAATARDLLDGPEYPNTSLELI